MTRHRLHQQTLLTRWHDHDMSTELQPCDKNGYSPSYSFDEIHENYNLIDADLRDNVDEHFNCHSDNMDGNLMTIQCGSIFINTINMIIIMTTMIKQ